MAFHSCIEGGFRVLDQLFIEIKSHLDVVFCGRWKARREWRAGKGQLELGCEVRSVEVKHGAGVYSGEAHSRNLGMGS